ncbi:MAG TPA: ATP-binding protein [Rhodanobacteraceae bacterium]
MSTRGASARGQGDGGRPHQVVLISGPPGAGKSTLAASLAQALGFALLSKDTIKEALFDSLRVPAGDEAWSRRLSNAAMDTLFALAAHCPRVVLDANFKPDDPHQREHLAALGDSIVELHCRCDPQTAMRRYAERAHARHPAHALKQLTPELVARYDTPVHAGVLIELDTNAPADFPALLRRVREALPR